MNSLQSIIVSPRTGGLPICSTYFLFYFSFYLVDSFNEIHQTSLSLQHLKLTEIGKHVGSFWEMYLFRLYIDIGAV